MRLETVVVIFDGGEDGRDGGFGEWLRGCDYRTTMFTAIWSIYEN